LPLPATVVSIHARTRRATLTTINSYHKRFYQKEFANLNEKRGSRTSVIGFQTLFTCQKSIYKNREPPSKIMIAKVSRCTF
jgi:hypothetical protein